MRCKQFIFVSLAGVVLAASLAGCGTSSTAPSAVSCRLRRGCPRLLRCRKL